MIKNAGCVSVPACTDTKRGVLGIVPAVIKTVTESLGIVPAGIETVP